MWVTDRRCGRCGSGLIKMSVDGPYCFDCGYGYEVVDGVLRYRDGVDSGVMFFGDGREGGDGDGEVESE